MSDEPMVRVYLKTVNERRAEIGLPPITGDIPGKALRRYAPESLTDRVDRFILDLIDRVRPNVLELAGWALAAIVIGALAGITIAIGAGCGS